MIIRATATQVTKAFAVIRETHFAACGTVGGRRKIGIMCCSAKVAMVDVELPEASEEVFFVLWVTDGLIGDWVLITTITAVAIAAAAIAAASIAAIAAAAITAIAAAAIAAAASTAAATTAAVTSA